jgi:hypothetical protein
MRKLLTIATSSCLIALSACGGNGDDALGDNAADAAEAKADNLEAAADNAATPAQERALEAQADVVEQAGEAREEAIDDADVNAQAMTPAQKEAVVNGM